MSVVIAVLKEVAPGERRVALVPDVVAKLTGAGHEVRVQSGAGEGAGYPDATYSTAGAKIVPDPAALGGGAQLVLSVQPPSAAVTQVLAPGTLVVGFLNPTRALDAVARLRDGKLTSFAMELIPRISRAQSMDGLSSQATVAGYKAALIGAELTPKFFPMLTTAAGTIRPAKVLILGAGVAGLMAIATARRLGAVVEAYDVRRAAGEQVRSLGAKFLELQINAEGSGGYARELTPEEKVAEQTMLAEALTQADVVITTANIPGRKAPRLIAKDVVGRMRPGSVIVDLAAEGGGNCELTQPGETVVVGGVTIAGPLNLPSTLPFHASQMYSKNLQSLLTLLITKEGQLVTDFSDEVLAGSLLTKGGEVVYAPARDALAQSGAK
jgi:H+-translocating NAD(P) transhydrogenase subunit alpha